MKELGKVFPGKVQVTVHGYYTNGEYYSFRTAVYQDERVRIEDLVKEKSYLIDLPIKRISTSFDGSTLWIDVIEDIGEKSTNES